MNLPNKHLATLPYAYGIPPISGVLRYRPEDFFVEEILGFEPEGEGEHVFLWIEKIGLNTQQVAERLGKLAKVPDKQINYSGMKDRHAVTRQWFGVHLPGKSVVDWEQLNGDDLTVITVTRHRRKLRRGVHKANRFVIGISELKAEDLSAAKEALTERIAIIAAHGVPNYFGEQRFGRDGMNLVKVQQWFEGQFNPKRYQRGIYLSAARSYLFNLVLARRVEDQSWSRLMTGELLLLNGSNSVFPQSDERALENRLLEGDIHLTGPLYGKPGILMSDQSVKVLEADILASQPLLLEGLEREGLKAERRSLRVIPSELNCQVESGRVELSVTLPSGCFATSLLRELIHYQVSSRART